MLKKLLINSGFVLIKVMSDVCFIFIAFLLAYMLRLKLGPAFEPGLSVYTIFLFYVVLLWITTFFFLGLYRSRKGFFIEVDECMGLLVGTLIGILEIIVVSFIFDEFLYARSLLYYAWLISFVLLCVFRIAIIKFEYLLKAMGLGSRRIAIIGDNTIGQAMAERIERLPSLGYQFVGYIDSEGGSEHGDALEKKITDLDLDEIFIAVSDFPRAKLLELSARQRERKLKINLVPDLLGIFSRPVEMSELDDIPLISIKERSISLSGRIAKRSMDLIVSVVVLIVFLPFILVISGLIKLTSPGPIFYQQERVGRNGRVFKLIKFRTMEHNAEAKTGPVKALVHDPRRTTVGRVLRKTHLDEMPQLFNVLRGDMSLVGPRPERPFFVDKYIEKLPRYAERHNVKPGLAGFAQISGDYDLPFEEKVKHDFYYIENWSLLMDIKLIIRMLIKACSFRNRY